MRPDPRLDQYHKLLLKWQEKINLISPATIQNAWQRHFEDSLQLLPYIPDSAGILFDIGSGAGFPGLVLAIQNSGLDVHLIESDQKKCSFLKTVSRETKAPVTIHSSRIENISRETDIVPDVITARALAHLNKLLGLTEPWWSKNSNLVMILPKGAQADEEVQEAQKLYDFNIEKFISKTDKNAQVLVLKHIKHCA
ncbi:MAG: 16S rRNA (guanine(527)-N(7))-methyltransferase RsmG [Pseudomonadota bacterium]